MNLEKRFADIKLIFVAYPYNFGPKNPPIIIEIDSSTVFFDHGAFNTPQRFKIIGINYSCGIEYKIENCEVFEKSFQSKSYSLLEFLNSANINIDLSSLLSTGLKKIRKIEYTDSIISSEEFKINGKHYVKKDKIVKERQSQ